MWGFVGNVFILRAHLIWILDVRNDVDHVVSLDLIVDIPFHKRNLKRWVFIDDPKYLV